jgi:hypothetical protein
VSSSVSWQLTTAPNTRVQPIPPSVFPSTYRSDAQQQETTSVTKVEGQVSSQQQRVGREDTRYSKEEIDVDINRSSSRRGRNQYEREDVRIYEERDRNRYPEVELTREK